LHLAQQRLQRLLARLLFGVQRVVLGLQGGFVRLRVGQGLLQGVGVSMQCAELRLRLCRVLLQSFRLLARLLVFRALAQGGLVGAFDVAQARPQLLRVGFGALHFGRKRRGVGVHLLPFAFEGVQRGESLLLLLAQALGFLLQRLAEFGKGALAFVQPIAFAQRALFGGQLALQHRAQGVHLAL
jgi:hypothetical protein